MSEREVIAAVEEVVAPLVERMDKVLRQLDLLHAKLKYATFSKQEAAAYCGVSTRTIDRKVQVGLLRPVPGKSRRFTLDELDRAVREGVL